MAACIVVASRGFQSHFAPSPHHLRAACRDLLTSATFQSLSPAREKCRRPWTQALPNASCNLRVCASLAFVRVHWEVPSNMPASVLVCGVPDVRTVLSSVALGDDTCLRHG
jgi:hypothetical protein